MTREQVLAQRREDILAIAGKHGIRNVRVFGSVARGETGEASDVDFLVELEPGKSLFDMLDFQEEAGKVLGCKVDVLTEDGIYWLLRRRILKEARALSPKTRCLTSLPSCSRAPAGRKSALERG